MARGKYDFSKLKGRIIEVFGTRKDFGKAMKWSNVTITSRVNGASQWRQDEIDKAVELLHIDAAEIGEYFFRKVV